MDQNQLRSLLEQVREGAVDVDGAITRLRHMPFEDLGFAKLDHHRAIRHGMPEVVFGKGKTPEHIEQIALHLSQRASNVLVTRANDDAASRIRRAHPEAEYFPMSGAIRLWRDRTGLPMVFAVWAATEPIVPGLVGLEHALVASVRLARSEPELLAREASITHGYPPGYLARYFEKLRYSFGPREREGLRRFLDLARDVGELDSVPELRFVSEEEALV